MATRFQYIACVLNAWWIGCSIAGLFWVAIGCPPLTNHEIGWGIGGTFVGGLAVAGLVLRPLHHQMGQLTKGRIRFYVMLGGFTLFGATVVLLFYYSFFGNYESGQRYDAVIKMAKLMWVVICCGMLYAATVFDNSLLTLTACRVERASREREEGEEKK